MSNLPSKRISKFNSTVGKQSMKPLRGSNNKAFTLVEMMVAMLIGLIIIAGIMMLFVSSKQTYRLNTAMTHVHDNGRFAMNYLVSDLRKAGWVDSDIVTVDGHSLAAPFDQLTNNIAVTGGQSSDGLTVRYYGEENCIGDKPADGIVRNQYQLQATADGLPELKCNGASLIKNVESFQIRYGVLTANGLQYVTSDSVSDISLLQTLQIAFSVASDEKNVIDKNVSLNGVLDEGPYTFNDGRYRKVFSSTIVLNNNGHQPPDSLLVSE
ncbi:MAG: PilW family protein [Kangiella sp.]|nr:PilW family protein [Kangiella sp.]